MAKKKKGNNKQHSKKKKEAAETNEVALDLPGALKALCILSFAGFMYCLLLDTSDYFAYTNFEELANSADQAAFEKLEDRLHDFEFYGVDISARGLERLSVMSIYRTLIDILAMVGTALMYFKIRKGFYIYTFFQVLYILTPFLMFGLSTFAIFDKGMMMIPIVYVGLFTTQLKHMTR